MSEKSEQATTDVAEDDIRLVLKDALHFLEQPNQRPAMERSTHRIFTAKGTAERIRTLLKSM